jgi:hypothetical protein
LVLPWSLELGIRRFRSPSPILFKALIGRRATDPPHARLLLELAVWCFPGAWCLEFGASDRRRRSSSNVHRPPGNRSTSRASSVELGAWSFSGAWSLEFGASLVLGAWNFRGPSRGRSIRDI